MVFQRRRVRSVFRKQPSVALSRILKGLLVYAFWNARHGAYRLPLSAACFTRMRSV